MEYLELEVTNKGHLNPSPPETVLLQLAYTSFLR